MGLLSGEVGRGTFVRQPGAGAGAGAAASVAYPPILYLDNGVLLALAVATFASTRTFEVRWR